MIYALKMWLKGRLSQAQWEWLKHLRQRLVGRRAYMNPSYAIEGEDRIVRALLWQKRDSGFYVDVGAHHPFRFSNTYLFYTQGWRGINIDATPGSMEAFRKYRARDINLEMGIGEITESSAKNLAQDNLAGGGGSSLAKTFLAYHIFDESSWNTFDEEVAKTRSASFCAW
ncbi:hypothetical protein LS71_004220 [Helicobacter jaachi]|uniref:Uncharacterized protein n=1 Tax=Helicobacter jaachi TaxID=1677920 RepID=A0A4U8TAG4_9HELI|nr:hypothetical protein [Helicobacter jaachi]TLD96815.1 hypothetical protein LS71_004220 [Helicobacter jaachi]